MSPSGESLAVLSETELCDGGYRAGNIRVLSTTGDDKAVLAQGTCEVFYTDPRWIDDSTLAAARLSRTAPGEYDAGVVTIDVATGAVTDLITEGRITHLTVSPSLGLLAYALRDVEGFSVLDLQSGTTTTFAEGFVPHLSGENRF